MAFPSAIGCIVIGQSPIASGPHCQLVVDDHVCRIIPSYLYWQYKDDDNLQAFVDSYNSYAQEFAEWFCSLNLPIYTTSPVDGALLNWVGEGLYGYPRPVLGSGSQVLKGPYNTWQFNSIQFNQHKLIGEFTADPVDDDLYRRMITWHFWKGDGRQFNIRNLKRKIMRFLEGENGIDPPVDQTYRISVSFGACCQVDITLIRYRGRVTRSFRFNQFQFNVPTFALLESSTVTLYSDQFELAQQLKEAIEQGALELPFQYKFIITIQ